MMRHKVCDVLAILLLVTCGPITAAAQEQEKGKGKGVRVILLTPEDEMPLSPPGNQPPPTTSSTREQPPPESLPSSGPTPPQPAPLSQPATPRSASQRQPGESARGLAATVLQQNLGPERFKSLRDRLEASGCGRGGPCPHTYFDRAAPATGPEPVVNPQGSRFFSGSIRAPSVERESQVVETYGGIPGGGIILEGTATGLNSIEEIGYDRKYNALILDSRAVYFVKIPPKTLAELCRAIAQKNEVGVSLGGKRLVYGAVGKNSDLAYDMTLADRFLGNIVFARNDWSHGYRFAGGYVPQTHDGALAATAVFFRFNAFEFQVQGREVVPTNAMLEVTLVPLSSEQAPDGNLLPDLGAIRTGSGSPQFEANARHIAENVAYYRQEQIVRRTFVYGEVAALLRWLKSEGTDLNELAAIVK